MVKNLPDNAGNTGSICGSGRSPGEGNGNPLQYSCLENPMDREAWWAPVQRVAKSWTWLRDFTSLVRKTIRFWKARDLCQAMRNNLVTPHYKYLGMKITCFVSLKFHLMVLKSQSFWRFCSWLNGSLCLRYQLALFFNWLWYFKDIIYGFYYSKNCF